QEGANLNGENTVLAELWERHVAFSQTEIRSSLARCGLFEEDMQKPVKSLSGGERAKLALCIAESEKGNFLLFDEPTNHLDLPARESLEKALQSFDGTLLFVSHDRYFISAVARKIVEIENGKLVVYDGDYEFYAEEKRRKREQAQAEEERLKSRTRDEEKKNSYRSKKERAEEERKKDAVKKLEQKICGLEEEEAGLNAELSDPAVAADYKKVNEILEKLQAIKLQLDGLYKDYEAMI
ncbi:MAG: ATP-binding cassette domain-containing protein, partial [Clostridia bacterium]|nr:ATP-binding cassette domain-containing protein [Clostridia bacterium]